jgi:alkaline phosphatase
MTRGPASGLAARCGGLLLALLAARAPADGPVNVVLMVSDGQGFNAVQAAALYAGAPAVFEGFPVKLAVQTHSAGQPAGYDPERMWADFAWALSGATDSAAAATAMVTGVKVGDGQLNWGLDGAPLRTFFETASERGMATGAVSSVPFSHATPAAVYAHRPSRNDYAAIAREGLLGDWLDVLVGAGHPFYDQDGAGPRPAPAQVDYVGGLAAWEAVSAPGGAAGWTLVESRAGFEAIAAGAAPAPARLLGVARASPTLQNDRSRRGGDPSRPSGDALNPGVPSLATLTRAALRTLGQNPAGFALLVEGGAVDWAAHARDLPRLIEEQTDFNAAVQAVVDWVEHPHNPQGGWERNLLVVTGDHETGHLWGPGTFTDGNGNGAYDAFGPDAFHGYRPLEDRGSGQVPGHQFGSRGHTGALVPLYARGTGSERFRDLVVGHDPRMAEAYGPAAAGFTGHFVDNTAVHRVVVELLQAGDPRPPPGDARPGP